MKNRLKSILSYIFSSLVFILFIFLFLFLLKEFTPLWTMKVQSKSFDISTFKIDSTSSKARPLRVEIITDFDNLSISKLALDKVFTLTLKEKPDILIFLGKVGENGISQKKILSMFYLLQRFNITPERIFVVPRRGFYERLLENTKNLLYYIDFFKTIDAYVVFGGIEPIRDSLSFIMASSIERIEHLKGRMKGIVLILADHPDDKATVLFPEVFISTKKLKDRYFFPTRITVVKKGIMFLNLY